MREDRGGRDGGREGGREGNETHVNTLTGSILAEMAGYWSKPVISQKCSNMHHYNMHSTNKLDGFIIQDSLSFHGFFTTALTLSLARVHSHSQINEGSINIHVL